MTMVFMQQAVRVEPSLFAGTPGEIISVLGADVPDEMLPCDGSAYKRRHFAPDFAGLMRVNTSWWRWHLLRQFRTPVLPTQLGIDLGEPMRDGFSIEIGHGSRVPWTEISESDVVEDLKRWTKLIAEEGMPTVLPYQEALYHEFSVGPQPWCDPLLYWDGKEYRHRPNTLASIWGTGKLEVLPSNGQAMSGPHPTAEHRDEVELMDEEAYREAMATGKPFISPAETHHIPEGSWSTLGATKEGRIITRNNAEEPFDVDEIKARVKTQTTAGTGYIDDTVMIPRRNARYDKKEATSILRKLMKGFRGY